MVETQLRKKSQLKQPDDDEEIVTLDQISNDPLEMPPPYWRSSGAIFHLLDSVDNLIPLLFDLVPVLQQTQLQLDEYFHKYPNDGEDPELQEFREITADLVDLELKIKVKAESAILMSGIQAEDDINQFCVFNLHKDVAESIEKLSPAEKLLIASTAVGKKNAKSNAAFEAIKKLTSWRNAFAHGHCVDRPTKSLRLNHLISPSQYPGVPDSIDKVKQSVSGYVRIREYLRAISLNKYTAAKSVEVDELQKYLREIGRFRFTLLNDSNDLYTVEYAKS